MICAAITVHTIGVIMTAARVVLYFNIQTIAILGDDTRLAFGDTSKNRLPGQILVHLAVIILSGIWSLRLNHMMPSEKLIR